jgi:hypothetical protein
MINLLSCFLDSFFWRVRGGLRINDKKLPLNKIWFALVFAAEFCYMTGWDWNIFIIVSLAVFVSYQAFGWGEYIGCLLTGTKPTERSDCSLVDDIVDTLKITYKGKVYKLTDYPRLFGWVGTSLRGLIMTFIIGLPMLDIPFMLCGLAMGTVYGIGGLIDHYVIKDGKFGWCWAEYLWGLALGIFLILFI